MKKGEDFRQIYITGAFGNFTPFDYRLMLFTHKAEFPDQAQEITGFPIPQVIQAEVVMSEAVARQLRDLLIRQMKERENTTKKAEEKGVDEK